jgi:hypothetical protein
MLYNRGIRKGNGPAGGRTPRSLAHKELLMDITSVAYVLCRIEDDSSLTPVSEHQDLSAGMAAGKHRVEGENFDFSYSLYTADMVARVARFAEGRVGYREWARRRGYIHSLEDRLDHDVDELLA